MASFSSLSHTAIFEWQFSNNLDDRWWVSISGTTAQRHYSLVEIRSLKENSPQTQILILHNYYTDSTNPEWIEYVLEQSSHARGQPARGTLSAPTYHPKYEKWNATLPQMVRLAVSAITSCKYVVINVNENVGLVTFETREMSWGSFSGITCSLQISEHESNWFTVVGSGKQNIRGGQLMAFDLFGESNSVVKKVISVMARTAR